MILAQHFRPTNLRLVAGTERQLLGQDQDQDAETTNLGLVAGTEGQLLGQDHGKPNIILLTGKEDQATDITIGNYG